MLKDIAAMHVALNTGIKTNFIAYSQLLYMGCPLMRERKQKKNPIFILKSVCVHFYEEVSAYRNV